MLPGLLLLAGCLQGTEGPADPGPDSLAEPWPPASVRYFCGDQGTDSPCPLDPEAGLLARASRAVFHPNQPGTAIIAYVLGPENPSPGETSQLWTLVTRDGGKTWTKQPGPVLEPNSAFVGDTRPIIHGVYGVGATFRPSGALVAGVGVSSSVFAVPDVYSMESPDLGATWGPVELVPDATGIQDLTAAQGRDWLAYDGFESGIAWRLSNQTTWETGLESAIPGERCRDFGGVVEHQGRLFMACSLAQVEQGTVTVSTTRGIVVVEIDAERRTYEERARSDEELCFGPFTLLPMRDGRFFVQFQCQRDVGKPILAFVMQSWLVDVANNNWTQVKGPLGATPGFNGGDGTVWVDAQVDAQGLVHMLSWCVVNDTVDPRLQHEVTLYIAWDPMTDSAVLSQVWTDRPWLGNDPVGLSPLTRVYGQAALWAARSGPPFDGSLAIQGQDGLLAWNTDTGIAVQWLRLGD